VMRPLPVFVFCFVAIGARDAAHKFSRARRNGWEFGFRAACREYEGRR
jgi:hypothetical protein